MRENFFDPAKIRKYRSALVRIVAMRGAYAEVETLPNILNYSGARRYIGVPIGDLEELWP